MTNLRLALVGVLLAGLAACGSPAPDRAGTVPLTMKFGYLDHAREMGAAGISDEQLIAAGLYVCDTYGEYSADADPAKRQGAYTALVDDELDLIPDDASGPTVTAVLTGTPFLCLGDS